MDILVTSKNGDRKIMQSMRIMSRAPSRIRKWNQLSQFRWTSTKVIPIENEYLYMNPCFTTFFNQMLSLANGLEFSHISSSLATTSSHFLHYLLFDRLHAKEVYFSLHENENFRLTKICEKNRKGHIFVSFRMFPFHGDIIFSEISFKRKYEKAASFRKCVFLNKYEIFV